MIAYDRMPDVVRRNNVEIGIIAVTAKSAQDVYALADAGVRAVLNFAPRRCGFGRG